VSLILAAERVLERLLSHAPGDASAMLALERSQSARGDYIEAEKTLRALLEADPKSAAVYLARLADHAEAAYRDADALGYIERLVKQSPRDASAHARLARLYRDRQQLDRARASYEQAIELDSQSYAVHLELADLLLARGDELAADGLFLRVVRGSQDDQQVRRAALSLTQIRLARSTLASLEDDLLPLSLGERSRAVHRALLCELYATLARPWLAALSEGGPLALSARAKLQALGKRAVKPLLEALASEDPSARRVAVDLLAPMEHPSAAAALLGTAEREGDVELRRRALLGAGAVADEALLARCGDLGNRALAGHARRASPRGAFREPDTFRAWACLTRARAASEREDRQARASRARKRPE
jgi:hypothetical protein